MVVALDSAVRDDILRLAGEEFQAYYSRKVAILTDFSSGCLPSLQNPLLAKFVVSLHRPSCHAIIKFELEARQPTTFQRETFIAKILLLCCGKVSSQLLKQKLPGQA